MNLYSTLTAYSILLIDSVSTQPDTGRITNLEQEALQQLQQQWQPFIDKAKQIDYHAIWNALTDLNYKELFDENAVEKYGEKGYYLLRGIIHNILERHAASFSSLFSSPCKNHMYEYLMVFVDWNFTTGPNNTYQEWAVRMLDSSGKFESGELTQRKKHVLGDFGQCTQALHYDRHGHGQMLGQYCTLIFTPKPKDVERVFDQNGSKGVCLPSTCSQSELSQVLNEHWSSNTTDVTIPPGGCITAHSPAFNDPHTKSPQFYLWVLISIIGVSTVIDWWQLSADQNKTTRSYSSSSCSSNRIYKCFSLLDSWHRLVSLPDSHADEDLGILDGLLALSFINMAFIIEFLSFLIRPAYNLYYLIQFMNSWGSLMLMQTLPLDTFYFCTSCKLAYHQYHLYQQPPRTYSSFLKLPSKLIIRWLGVIVFTLVVVSPFVPGFGNGHWAFYSNAIGYANCQPLFWNKILFIDNFTGHSRKCLGHLTYLSVGSQLVVLSPLLLYVGWKHRRAFTVAIPTIATLSIIYIFTIVNLNHLPPSLFAATRVDFYETIQVSPITRAVPWLAGLWIGTKLAQDKHYKIKLTLNKNVRLLSLMIVGLLAMSALVWVRAFELGLGLNRSYDATQSAAAAAAYAALHAVPWVAALSFLTYITAHGYGGIVSSVMRWRWFRMMGQLSTNGLMVYYVWRLISNAHKRDIAFLSYFHMWNDFLPNTVVSLLGSAILYLLIDGPLIKIVDFMFAKSSQTKSTKKLVRKKLN